jgi:DNA-binding MarR family transcriptional regulator
MRAPDPFQNSRSVPGLSDNGQIKRDSDRKLLTDETVRSLNEQLSESALKSSTRILILVLLAQARRMSSVELRILTGLGKGSLENHLNKLESFGYVRLSNSKSIGARGLPRQIVEITDKGLESCRGIVKSISNLAP